ncbi:MAG TPA: hypothetical protein VFA21_06095 [Pyrinomonadaceae bacterium]|nr:hypothetical protein [Pyrinomonadaceae bacterium]
MKTTKLIYAACLVIGFCAASASRAEAQCGVSLHHGNGGHAALNAAAGLAGNQLTAPANAAATSEPDRDDATIVGLWDVKFISEGQIVDEGFDQYHDDGLEILNDTPPPATGNICLGVYEKTGPRTLKLRHPSWIYDQTNTTVVGRATILENIKLDKGGRTFTGTFTIKFTDLFGNSLGPDFTGQLKGDRITP